MKRLSLFVAALALLAAHCFSDEKPNSCSDCGVLKKQIIGLWMLGQSLCDGSESLPIVTSTISGWGNYRFGRGVRTWVFGHHVATPEERPDEQFVFVPLTAKKNGGLGETIANGLADHLKAASLDSHNDARRKTGAPHFLAAYAGQGGRLIDELSSVDQSTAPRTPPSRQHGGGYYQTSLDDARRARAQTEAMGVGFHSLCGFQIRDASRAVSAITAVLVASPTLLRIRLATPLKEGATFTLSYGLPYAGQIGTIASIRKGAAIADQPTTELLLDRNVGDRLKPLPAEGTFYVTNMLNGDTYARTPVRHVYEDDGITVLRFENRERQNNTDFAVGQTLTTPRPYSYGNLRDSDPEKAIYQFADSAYGTRDRRSYPLWNWCVLINRLPI